MGQLMEAAERLFARQGVAGTSLQALADEVGLSRTSIYHYIRSKEDMLAALVEGFTLHTARDLRRLANSAAGPAIDRLREGVTNMALLVAQHPQRFRLLLTSESALPDPLGKQYRDARRETLAALKDLICQAIKEGSCRPVDEELAAFALFGVSNWVAFWYPRAEGAGGLGPDRLAPALASLALEGIVEQRATGDSDSVSHVISLLRQDLSRLERMLEHD